MQADSLPVEPPGRPTVYGTVEMGLCSTLCASLDGRGVWERMDTCIRTAEFFQCSPETITALLIGYNTPWASLGVQLVKNSPAMWETWVRALGWEDPLAKGKAHSSILAWRIPWTV